MSDSNLHEVIADAVNDTIEPETAPETSTDSLDASSDTSVDTSTDSVDTDTSADSTDATEAVETSAVESPAARTAVADPATEDKFAKEFGIQPQMIGGRENRIPYSRVKAIVAKAQEKALAPVSKELETYRTENATYKAQLAEVAQLENLIMNDAPGFLQRLAAIPAYKAIFENLTYKGQETQVPTDEFRDMPQPDLKLGDGSMVYSPEAQKAWAAWQQKKIEDKVTKQISDRYAPIEEAWQTQERLNQIVPKVQAQIDTARKWPMFTDNEQAIVEVLRTNPHISLEGAYQQVVLPKLVPNRDQMRQEILREIKSKPVASTSTPATGTRPGAQTGANKSLEDVIAESVGLTYQR